MSTTYVPPTEQLVVEIYARDLARSIRFYQALGFEVISIEPDFVVLAWEGHQLFLEARSDLPAPRDLSQANMRIMVPDVDRYWSIAQQLGAPVIRPIAIASTGCAISPLPISTASACASARAWRRDSVRSFFVKALAQCALLLNRFQHARMAFACQRIERA